MRHEAPMNAEWPTVPDFELIQRIGGGAYGDVWLARSATGVLRAVKVVYRRTFDDARPFEREFEGIQHFERISREHPSQLALFHVGRNEPAGYFYYVMELADDASERSDGVMESWSDGKPGSPELSIHHSQTSSLDAFNAGSPHHSTTPPLRHSNWYAPHTLRHDLKERGRLPASEVLELALALTEALAQLHGHGLVHRDIKPSNIIFVGGRPKLADIGLVTDTGDSRSIVGTEGYLAPEGPGSPQADLYALGMVLYEALTGLDRHRFPDLPPDLRSWPDADGVWELNAIMLKACARERNARYRTAEALREELAHVRKGRSVRRRRAREQALQWTKRLAAPTVLVALLAVVLTTVWRSQTASPVSADPRISIFVLPFRHSAPGLVRAESWELPTDVCLCGRLTDAFIDSLPLIPGIRTGPRKSGWVRYDEDQVRHNLIQTNDTRYILTGRVDHTNDTLRLALRLYERQNETPVWTETFAGTTNEVLTLEQRAINAIARRLDRAVPEGIQRQIDLTLSNNLAAYGLFQRARSLYVLATSANLHQALADYIAALDADPRYTAAMVGIMWLRGEIGFDQPPRTVQTEIYNRAQQLLALDDTVFLAHSRIVYRHLYYDYDWDEALQYMNWMRSVWPEENLETAIWLRTLGRTNEARIYHERLQQQPDPGLMELCFIAYGECVCRQYDAALAAAERLRALYPDSAWSPFMLGWVHLRAGNHREAIDYLRQAAGPGPGPQLLGLLGRAYALAGDRATALDFLRQLEPRVVAGEVDPYFLAWIQMGLGQAEDALRNLEKAADFKSPYIVHSEFGGLRTDPAWDAFQGDPRFEKLCESVGMGKGQWPK
jgi:tetratricopeptide (TPR) repeat protein